ncbi:hypothetical protein HX049_02735 [Myroides odoratimimus]|uniref:hypothetical protein n=1 Tax=Myroides odoratimimus TaxID=76832 RepID=UPI002574DD6E|nr:hypothetical protein [Myroides odoratimimus]MDM1396097.1 hypothetical protein [Myroides odoratimimus]
MEKFISNNRLFEVYEDSHNRIHARLKINLFGKEEYLESDFTLAELELFKQNKSNPNSCESETNSSEIKLLTESFFLEYVPIIHVNKVSLNLIELYTRAVNLGFNFFNVPRADYDAVIDIINKENEESELLKLNDINYSKANVFYKAKCYNESIQYLQKIIDTFKKNDTLIYLGAYNKLILVYRKLFNKEAEIKLIELTIKRLNTINRNKFEKAIIKYPDYYSELENGLNQNIIVKDKNDNILFMPYEIKKLIIRKHNLKMKK